MYKTLIFRLISVIGISFFLSCESSSSESKKENKGLEIGQVLPNIKMTSPKGSQISLENLRGSVVLVDFWASWCSPCRKENKNLVAYQEKFENAKFSNGKGFKIFSVSLDGSGDTSREKHHKNLWKKTIEADQLVWPYHVSDLKGWTSPLIDTYKIDAIPMSYLIDGKGKIIAKDIKGEELEKQLIALLDSK